MAYKQVNNPFKKKDTEKENLSFAEQVALSGKDPYEKTNYYKDYRTPTGFDDRGIVNPRTYKAVRNMPFGGRIHAQLYGAEYASDNEKRRKKYMPNEKSKLTDFDRAKMDIIDKTNKMDVDQFNSIVKTLSDFGNKFEGKSKTKKFKALMSADLDGVKKVASELGITKNQIIDLVKAPEKASMADKLKAKAIRAYLNAKL
tara:strand:+ start:82 stop:681 length:600 start_codon:yes stop_codon:yes gene_type:complete